MKRIGESAKWADLTIRLVVEANSISARRTHLVQCKAIVGLRRLLLVHTEQDCNRVQEKIKEKERNSIDLSIRMYNAGIYKYIVIEFFPRLKIRKIATYITRFYIENLNSIVSIVKPCNISHTVS